MRGALCGAWQDGEGERELSREKGENKNKISSHKCSIRLAGKGKSVDKPNSLLNLFAYDLRVFFKTLASPFWKTFRFHAQLWLLSCGSGAISCFLIFRFHHHVMVKTKKIGNVFIAVLFGWFQRLSWWWDYGILHKLTCFMRAKKCDTFNHLRLHWRSSMKLLHLYGRLRCSESFCSIIALVIGWWLIAHRLRHRF